MSSNRCEGSAAVVKKTDAESHLHHFLVSVTTLLSWFNNQAEFLSLSSDMGLILPSSDGCVRIK